jgi:uncharacterized protein YukE
MLSPTRIAAVVAVLVVLAAVPAAATAGTVPMRGVVSGSPYGASNGQMAVPVLFSKMTARNAGLKSPVGVIILKRTQQVKLPSGGTTLPVNLRTGDRFKGFGTVGDLQRRVFYPRVVFSKPVVYFRSKELSLAELSAAIDALRNALGQLQNQLGQLQSGALKAFQDIYAQLADLRKQLAALQALSVPDFQSQIDALNKRLDDLIASLPDFSQFALISQLPDLSNYATLGDLTSAIAGLQSQIDALPTKTYVDAAVAGLQSQINTIKSTVNALATNYSALCTALKTYAVALPGLSCTTVPTIP